MYRSNRIGNQILSAFVCGHSRSVINARARQASFILSFDV